MEPWKILETLKSQEKITEEDIVEATKVPDEEMMKDCAYSLHMILCGKDHDKDCAFPQEEQIDDPWSQPDHEKWLEYTRDMLNKWGVRPEEVVEELHSELPIIIDQLDYIKSPFTLAVLKTSLNKIYSNSSINTNLPQEIPLPF